MTAGMVMWAMAVSALAAAAATGAATLLRAAGRPERWAWLTALALAGAAGPMTGVVVVQRFGVSRLASAPPPGGSAGMAALADLLRTPIPGFRAVAIGLGAALLLWVSAGLLLEARRHRTSRPTRRCGVPVYIDAARGPAVVPTPRPRVVLPRRIDTLSPRERRLVVLHEGEHVRAGDLQLQLLAVVLLAAAVWNPAVWWLHGRMARAIESDCDQRVLRGRDARRRDYVEVLLRTAGWQGAPSGLPGLAMSRSGRVLADRVQRVAAGAVGMSAPRVALGLALLLLLAAAPLVPRPAVPLVMGHLMLRAQPPGSEGVFDAREVKARERTGQALEEQVEGQPMGRIRAVSRPSSSATQATYSPSVLPGEASVTREEGGSDEE